MKAFSSFLLLILGIVCGLVTITFFSNSGTKNKIFTLTSPLPNALINVFPQVLGSQDPWHPNLSQKKGTGEISLSSSSFLAYDLTTDSFLYASNEKKRLPIASLTKIMTAIVSLENDSLNNEYVISKKSANIGENAMGITQGERLRLKDLLYGMMLPSGNDAAEAIAEGSRFGRDEFVYQMNKKAENLGLSNTRFSNPSGLEGDGLQYSTAVDLLILTRFAMQNSDFAKVVSTYEYEIPETKAHKYYRLLNDTNLLTTYPGVKGVKTGFTWEAGMCLVTYLEHDGAKIIAVILNSQDRRGEMKLLLDYSLISLGKTPPKHQ